MSGAVGGWARDCLGAYKWVPSGQLAQINMAPLLHIPPLAGFSFQVGHFSSRLLSVVCNSLGVWWVGKGLEGAYKWVASGQGRQAGLTRGIALPPTPTSPPKPTQLPNPLHPSPVSQPIPTPTTVVQHLYSQVGAGLACPQLLFLLADTMQCALVSLCGAPLV